jgi:hypothetical protein
MTTEKLSLGCTVITPGALARVTETEATCALRRHAAGDWGDLHPDDRALNQRSVAEGGRVFSEYRTTKGQKFWIITEADRSVTTILLPSEY